MARAEAVAAAVVVAWRGRCSTDRWTAEETRWPVTQSMVNKFRERPLGGTRGRPPLPGEEEGKSLPVRPAREGRNRGEGLRGRGGATGRTLRCLQHARVEPEDRRPSRGADRWNLLSSAPDHCLLLRLSLFLLLQPSSCSHDTSSKSLRHRTDGSNE